VVTLLFVYALVVSFHAWRTARSGIVRERAGIFVALIFLISEGASTFLSAELGNVAGLLAAAVVMFFLAPLQRFAERVASRAVPNTNNTPEYVSYRKMKVYEAAVAEAQQEGGISTKERLLLNRLRDSLGISSADAEMLEHELQSGTGSPFRY